METTSKRADKTRRMKKEKGKNTEEEASQQMMGNFKFGLGAALAVLIGASACSAMSSGVITNFFPADTPKNQAKPAPAKPAAAPEPAKPAAPETKFGFTRDDRVTVPESGMGVGTVMGFNDGRVVVKFDGEKEGYAIPAEELVKEKVQAVAGSNVETGPVVAAALEELKDFEVPLEFWEDEEPLAAGWSNKLVGDRLDWVRKHDLQGCNIPQYDCRLTPGQVKSLTENLKEPFMLRNCHHLSLNFSVSHLQEKHGHLNLDIYNVDPLTVHRWEGKRQVPLKQYLQDLGTTTDSAFDATEKSPVGSAIMKEFIEKHGSGASVPLFALTSLFKQRPVLSFSPTKGGEVPFHWHYPGYLFLQHGLKLWFVQSPAKPPESELAWHDIDKWVSKGYWDRVPAAKKPKHCLQQAGDLMYVPDAYWHATMALTQNFGYGYQGTNLATIKNLPHEFVDLKKKQFIESKLHNNKEDPWANMKTELKYYEWLRDNVQPWDFSNRILIADMKLAMGLRLDGHERQPHLQRAGEEYARALLMVKEGWEDKRLESKEAISLLAYSKETALDMPKFKEMKLNFLKTSGIEADNDKAAALIGK